MKIALLSTLTQEVNHESHLACHSMLRKMISKDIFSIAYIEYKSDFSNYYLNKANNFYNKIGTHKIVKFDLDELYKEEDKVSLLNFDVLHLGSGNTFDYLYQLQYRNYIDVIKNFSNLNKIIVGHSAGALLPSQTIGTAIFGDENDIGLKNLNSIGLIDFEFFPHWNKWSYYLNDLLKYSKENNKTIYIAEDGEGIFIDKNQHTIIGNMKMIINGIFYENAKFI